MTANEMKTNIGKKGFVNLNGLIVEVAILDSKNSYGVTRYQITALGSGNNSIWINASSITII